MLVAAAITLFVFTWPLERRHLQFTAYSFLTGAYTDATTIALYASDIAFVILSAAWWFRERRERLSNARQEQGARGDRIPYYLALWFFAWATFSSFYRLSLSGFDPDLTKLSVYVLARIGTGIGIFSLVSWVFRERLMRNVLLWSIVSVGTFQSVLGIYQVSIGSDLGLQLLGEQELSLDMPGIAKVDLRSESDVPLETSKVNVSTETSGNSSHVLVSSNVPTETKILRAYGTTQHPNVLAAILVSALASTLFLMVYYGYKKPIIHIFIVIISMGTLLTFSRAGWIAAALVTLTAFFGFYRNIGLRFLLTFTLGIILPVLLSGSVRQAVLSRIVPPENDQYQELRIISYTDFQETFRNHLVLGTGAGLGFYETVLSIDRNNINHYGVKTESWMYQYPHSVPAVIALETGLVGLGLFSTFFVSLLVPSRSPFLGRGRTEGFIRLVFPLTVLLIVAAPFLLDHYLWTTQQGRIILWGLLGVLAAARTSPPASSPASEIYPAP